MTLSIDDVKHVARLARMHMPDEELEQLRAQLSAILDYVALLQELDVEGVPPTFQISGLSSVTRSDEVNTRLSRDEALRNAPDKYAGMFRVRAVFDE
ncbi:MAG: Asp-tRNA(Asn)/Glu-tRNA(Gln) amidotransferase subunit GatC [Chloroflexaceae bacterium]|nr:Asp-tRNA(Asn)/Glu-tRNA(Gln) amidotransferase subunit GatC [Chloroflexaceae bacterium]NJL34459.1 Asp-tRNA(Asn)/Glu-tRNA(Gln) amidotransferase subunit GatC [Chloroflexaceae bacterium]NJO07500.1 Asp-tRNA(Asn)/Glu-tRNA(Gln) amidotransferase subunit GatC [Chloroflexaceae bacterium]